MTEAFELLVSSTALQAASTCSLTVAGIAHTFDACPSVDYSNAPLQYFYSLSSDASGSSTVLRGGIKAQGVGWAGWGFGSNQMAGTDAVIVKTDTSSSTGEALARWLSGLPAVERALHGSSTGG